MKNLVALVSFCVVLTQACTDNPINHDEISASGRDIQGQVLYQSGEAAEDVYIWLDGFDLATRTNATGDFSLTLPAQFNKPGAGGVTGTFGLYCYMANFELVKLMIAVRDGSVLDVAGSHGPISQPIMLSQRLQIETKVKPAVVSRAQIHVTDGRTDFLLGVEVSLSAPNDSVTVRFPGLVNGIYGPLMFRNIRTNEVVLLRSTIAGFLTSDYATVESRPVVRTMAVPLFPDDLEVGEYEVIPYLFVEDQPVPMGIQMRLNMNSVMPGPEYLDIPFLRVGSRRIVTIVP